MSSEERLLRYQAVMGWMKYPLGIAATLFIEERIDEVNLEVVLICHQLASSRSVEDPVILMADVKNAIVIKKARAIWKSEELAERRRKNRIKTARSIVEPVLTEAELEMAGT